MLFNSFEFLLFLAIVFFLYWFVLKNNTKFQNILLLVASYIFYGWWDYRFLCLIFISTIVDYSIGLLIHKKSNHKKKQKLLLWSSLLFNLGVLGFFKYYDFFIDSWVSMFNGMGIEMENSWTLHIILPVGISFYTFQTMSYSIDVYRKKITPTKDFISFASFVSFFPQLVAGPIERATNLLPQILNSRRFNYKQAMQALQLISWGMFKKVVIADSLAPVVNDIFTNYQDLDGGVLWLGVFLFAFQIYGDFSGYSDIAIGTAKLFGINLMVNFNFPYFSRNVGEFWKRWHISLSTWFRDYLYIPLGGSKVSKWQALRNIFIIFLVSGFWHGANWTFIFWGLIHALLYIPLFLFGTNRKYIGESIEKVTFMSSLKIISNVLATFFFVLLSWVFFRSESLVSSFKYIFLMFSKFSTQFYHINTYNNTNSFYLILLVLLLIFIEATMYFTIFKRFKTHRFFIIGSIVFNILMTLFLMPLSSENSFIYFQF